jgi:hypothetical protein
VPTPNTDLQSKITRAIQAVLIDQGLIAATIFAAPSNAARTLPNTTISIESDAFAYDGPGNWQFPDVRLTLRDDAIKQPDTADPESYRKTANDRWSNTYNALARSDDTHTLFYTATQLTALGNALATNPDPVIATDNADMADFTVLWWELVRQGAPNLVAGDGGGTFWEREMQFSCVVANTAL